MPNIASIFKGEISRLARKEQKQDTERLQKSVTQQRSELAAMKKRVAELERLIRTLAKKVTGKPIGEEGGIKKQVRFSPKRLQAWRKKHKLSAEDFGKLIGVSAQTIYHWESGKTRPKAEQIAKIAELRGLGKKGLAVRMAPAGVPGTTE